MLCAILNESWLNMVYRGSLTRTPNGLDDKNMEIIINEVALWRPNLHDGFTIKKHGIGTAYIDGNEKKVADKIIYRYAKNYSVGKGDNALFFCLFVRTFETAGEKVEHQLDEIAKTIKEKEVREIITGSKFLAFKYLEASLEDK